MILVEAHERFGNHMFQYAFGLAAARRLGTQLALTEHELGDVFDLSPPPLSEAEAAGSCERFVRIGNDDYPEPEELLATLQDGTRYRGYFQSERFFAGVADEVRAAFRVRADHATAFRERYGDLLERPYACCHVRRTDYVTLLDGVELPVAYYRRSLARLDLPPEQPVVFVGDDLEEVRAAFGDRPGVRFERNAAALDFQLLLHAQAVVVSNSTFAWWGAWLNAVEGRQVLAPRDWLGWSRRAGWRRTPAGVSWEYPPAVVPAGWIQIDVPRSIRSRLAPSALKTQLAALRAS
ncbi:MAG: hypothetical protein QOE29_2308 [Gaiellaceae bacterium]|nr:hypothetical protein [Gaiellaceae bacterium]